MATPTQLDRIEALLTSVDAKLNRIDLQNQQQTSLLVALTTGVQIMTQIATDTQAAVTALDAKVDTFIAAVNPALDALRAALAAAQAEVARLTADAAADTTTLQATIADANAETAKVQAAIDALTPPPAP